MRCNVLFAVPESLLLQRVTADPVESRKLNGATWGNRRATRLTTQRAAKLGD
jgi:hypothetical protein